MLVLNPDCCVMEGAVDCLITALRSTDRVGMAGPLLLNADGSEQAGGGANCPCRRLSLRGPLGRPCCIGSSLTDSPISFLHNNPLPQRPVEVEAISGACMMVRQEMITDIGPLDEGYFLHCEDLDWCMRA
jgi:GT2 family glycosyltransferase